MTIKGKNKYYFIPDEDGVIPGDKKEVVFPRCDHKGKVTIKGNVLTCKCGNRWQGAGVGKVYDELMKDVI